MATPRGSTAVAASGVTMTGGRAALPAWLASAPAYEWVEVPNSQPSLSAGLVPAVSGSMGSQSGMVNAWNGAVAHRGVFYIGPAAGGHDDYGGNEVPRLILTDAVPSWGLLIERTPVASLLGGSNYYADGRPTSRHGYYASAAVEKDGVSRLLRFNGWMGFAFNGPPVGGAADVRTTAVDGFRLDTNEWEPGAHGPVTTITGSETTFAQCPITQDCFAWRGSDGTIQRYVVATDTCSQILDLAGTEGQGAAGVFDAVAQRLIRFAGRASHKCTYADLALGTKVTPTLTGPDAADIAGLTGDNHGWGIALDEMRNVAYLLTNAAVLYRIRLSDLYVKRITPTGATAANPPNGCWGRLQRIPELDAIAYLASWTTPMLVMRCGD